MTSVRIKRGPPRKRQSRSVSTENNATDRLVRIGEAAKLVGVEAYVLRFWETQFSFIRPKQSHSGHRYYTRADIETLKIVKRLLHTEGYTIAGARKFFRERGLDRVRRPLTLQERASSDQRAKEQVKAAGPDELGTVTINGIHRALREIREDLRALHKLLDT